MRAVRTKLSRGRGDRSTQVATIEFKKDKWSLAAARAWLRKHGYSYDRVDTGRDFLHFRQKSPSKLKKEHFGTFRTKKIASGLELVFAVRSGDVRKKQPRSKTMKRGRSGATAGRSRTTTKRGSAGRVRGRAGAGARRAR
jgi:hypothetical protein